MAALSDSPSSDFGSDKKAGKERTKDKMTKFFDLLEEVVERHRLGARVLEEDEEERRVVGEEVVKLVVTSMRGFVGKYRDKELGKSECFASCFWEWEWMLIVLLLLCVQIRRSVSVVR